MGKRYNPGRVIEAEQQRAGQVKRNTVRDKRYCPDRYERQQGEHDSERSAAPTVGQPTSEVCHHARPDLKARQPNQLNRCRHLADLH